MDASLSVCRFVQFAAAMVIFGGNAFRYYALAEVHASTAPSILAGFDTWLGRPTLATVIVALLSALALLLCQAAAMAGSSPASIDPATVTAVLFETRFGRVWCWHLLLATTLVLVCLDQPPRRKEVRGIAGALEACHQDRSVAEVSPHVDARLDGRGGDDGGSQSVAAVAALRVRTCIFHGARLAGVPGQTQEFGAPGKAGMAANAGDAARAGMSGRLYGWLANFRIRLRTRRSVVSGASRCVPIIHRPVVLQINRVSNTCSHNRLAGARFLIVALARRLRWFSL